MILEKVFEFFGVSGGIILIVALLWKGDDFVSDLARVNIKMWFLQRSIPKTNQLFSMADKLMCSVFGEPIISLRSFLLSIAISLVVFVGVVLSFYFQTDIYHSLQLIVSNEWSKIFLNAAIACSLSGFLSCVVSRYILRKIGKSSNWLTILILAVFDLFCATFFPLIAYAIDKGDGDILSTRVHFGLLIDAIPALISSGFQLSQDTILFLFVTPISAFIISLFFNLFIWLSVCGFIVSVHSMRLNTLYSLATYALPFDEKPIRAFSIMVSLIFLVFFAIIKTAFSIALSISI